MATEGINTSTYHHKEMHHRERESHSLGRYVYFHQAPATSTSLHQLCPPTTHGMHGANSTTDNRQIFNHKQAIIRSNSTVQEKFTTYVIFCKHTFFHYYMQTEELSEVNCKACNTKNNLISNNQMVIRPVGIIIFIRCSFRTSDKGNNKRCYGQL